MDPLRRTLCAAPLCLLVGRASGQTPAQDAVVRSIKGIWDRPDAPLRVAPVVVEGDFAVAGWIQGAKGGRALLRQTHGTWSVHLCGGDGLTRADALQGAGMAAPAAERLTKALAAAESKLPASDRQKLSLFGATVRVEAGGNHHRH
jgi:hypothetical protein